MYTACLNNLLAACCSARLYCLSSKAWSRAAALCAEEANDRSFPAVMRPGAAPPAMPSRMQQISSSLSSARSKLAIKPAAGLGLGAGRPSAHAFDLFP